MEIGERIKSFIETSNQSQSSFARQTKINTSYLSRIINNKISPGVSILSKINTAGVSLDWLLNGTGSMFSTNVEGEKLKSKVNEKNDKDNSGSCGDARFLWTEVIG